jgi:hypothetical protein
MSEHKSAEELYTSLVKDQVQIDPLEKVHREIDEMYRVFKEEIDIDTVITKSEFDKFAMLYSADVHNRAATRDLSTDEIMQLAELSQEFYHRVNTHRPVHVVDDYTNNELFTLPPVFNNVRPIANDKAEIIDAYRAYNDPAMLKGNNSPVVEQKRNAIDQLMYQSIVESQPVEELKRSMTEFETLATNFHRKVLGNDPLHPDAPVTTEERDAVIKAQAEKAPPTDQNNNYDDDFDF